MAFAAAKATGKSKSTIHRAVKNGKISALRNDNGAYHIDAAELARVFPLTAIGTPKKDATAPGAEPMQYDLAILEIKVVMLEAQLGRERDTVDDLGKRLDRAEDRAHALPHRSTEPPRPHGFLRRWFG